MTSLNRYTTYSSKVDGGTNIADIEFSKKSAIVVGNEGKGVRQSTSDLCDEYLYIHLYNIITVYTQNLYCSTTSRTLLTIKIVCISLI